MDNKTIGSKTLDMLTISCFYLTQHTYKTIKNLQNNKEENNHLTSY